MFVHYLTNPDEMSYCDDRRKQVILPHCEKQSAIVWILRVADADKMGFLPTSFLEPVLVATFPVTPLTRSFASFALFAA